MLFFAHSVSHLMCYFGYFSEIQWYFSKLKKVIWYAKFGSSNFGKTVVLVILIIIYVNLCNYLLSPSPGAIICLYTDLHLYLYNCILFCIFSCFYWGWAKFNKFDCILALCMFNCLCKFEIIQYILKYKCICILFFHTILTVAQNTQKAYLLIILECYIVFV